ncbi:MAG: hypothetical protein CMM58_11090 [Rhodospirillaceae bacterium]|nr:hypothetical protein [Rhodospirillaceae bacterium]|tara:strand:+ start:1677 stop:2201 length:525 start_codon:yes stop_codon:yes gene_type:complete
MGFTWNAKEIQFLDDPNFIDRLGHYVHGNQSNDYKFSMDVMGYKAMYYTSEFEALVKSESSISALKNEIQQVCRGMFAREGKEAWEVSFKAEALIRNELDPVTNMPIGEVAYATDLVYSNTVLYSIHENANSLFAEWAHSRGLIEQTDQLEAIFADQSTQYAATPIEEPVLKRA